MAMNIETLGLDMGDIGAQGMEECMAPLGASMGMAQKVKLNHGNDFLLGRGHDCAVGAPRDTCPKNKTNGSVADEFAVVDSKVKESGRKGWMTRMLSKAGLKSSKSQRDVQRDVPKEKAAVVEPSSAPQLLPGVPKPWHGVKLSENEKAAKVANMKEELWRMVGAGLQAGSLKVLRRASTEPAYFIDQP